MNMVNFLTSTKDFRITRSDPSVYESYKYRNVKLYVTKKDLLFLEDYNVNERTTSFVFLSRHRSASGIASLTCHSTGNFSQDTLYGGKPNELGMANPTMLKAYFNELYRNRNSVPDYQITLRGHTSRAYISQRIHHFCRNRFWTSTVEGLECRPNSLQLHFRGFTHACKRS